VVAHQHLALAHRGQRRLHQLEIALHRLALGAVVQKDLLIDRHICLLLELQFDSYQRLISKTLTAFSPKTYTEKRYQLIKQ
jgi:hypothetical protein